MPQDLSDDKSTLVQVMAVRQQAISWSSVDQDLQRHMVSLGPNELSLLHPKVGCSSLYILDKSLAL